MAKTGLWLRGAKGKLAGTVLAKGASGQTIMRELVVPKNPKTEKQATQRMKMQALCNFYRGLNGILDHSWEGIKYGNPSRMHFMKIGLSSEIPVAAVAKGQKEFVALPLTVSEGSLQNIPFGYDTANSSFSITLTRSVTSADETALASRESAIPVLVDLLGVDPGTQLTFIVNTDVNRPNEIIVKRLILKQNVIDDFDWFNFAGTLSQGDASLFPILGDESNAYAVIVSREENGKWLRSTTSMILNPRYEQEVYKIEAVTVAKAQYMNKSSQGVNDDYLDEGASQPFGGVNYINFDNTLRILPGSTRTTSKATGTISIVMMDGLSLDVQKLSTTGSLKIDTAGGWVKGEIASFNYTVETGASTVVYDGFTILKVTKS